MLKEFSSSTMLFLYPDWCDVSDLLRVILAKIKFSEMLLNFKVKKKAGPPKNHEMSLLFRRSSKISTRPVLRLPYFVFQKIMLKFAEFLHCIARRCLENKTGTSQCPSW